MTMDLDDGFKMLKRQNLLNPDAKQRLYFWYCHEQGLVIDKVKVAAGDIKKALGGQPPKSPACHGRLGLYDAREGEGKELRLQIPGAVPAKLAKDLRLIAGQHGLKNVDIFIDDGLDETGEEDGKPMPSDTAALLQRLQELMPDLKKAQASPVAGAKLAELLQKAKKHIDQKDLAKAATDIDNLATLIPLALKHVAASGGASPVPGRDGSDAKDGGKAAPRDEGALQQRLLALQKKLAEAREIRGPHHDDIARLAKGVTDLARLKDFENGHKALDALERSVEAALADRDAMAAHEAFSAAVRKQKNKARATRLGQALDGVKSEKFFPAGKAAQYAKEGLKPGKEFQVFLTALGNFEAKYAQRREIRQGAKGSPVDFTPYEHDLAEMVQVTQAYLDHHARDLSDSQRKSSESQRKKQICEATLRMLKQTQIKSEYESLGAPETWDLKKENQAAALYAKVLFEEGDAPAQPLGSGESGVSGAWWVEALDFADPTLKNRKKKFIFKPSDAEAKVPGFPQGGSAIREVVSKVAVDRLQAATGLDFGFPETTLVRIDEQKLPDAPVEPGSQPEPRAPRPPGPRIGSMQHFNKGGEPLNQARKGNDDLAARLPKEEVHKAALMDLVTLNLDRHGGNFLVEERPGTDGKMTPRLVPIDHGLTLPSREGLDARRRKLQDNALNTMPAAREKFSPEMLSKIKLIDADSVVQGMKDSMQALKSLHPDQPLDAMVPEANFELTRRSIQFLQRAAPELTIDELFDAYAINAEDIFDSPPEQQQKAFAKAVQEAKSRSAARRELDEINADMSEEQRGKELKTIVQGLGWVVDLAAGDFGRWCAMNPKRVMNIFHHRIENAAMRKELDAMLQQLDADDGLVTTLRGESLRDGHAGALAALTKQGKAPVAAKPPKPAAGEVVQAMKEMEQELPGTRPADVGEQQEMATRWIAYRQLGGFHEFCRLGGEAEAPTLQDRLDGLRLLKANAASLAEVDAMSPDDLLRHRDADLARRHEAVLDLINTLVRASPAHTKLTMQYRDSLRLADAGDVDAARKALATLERDTASAIRAARKN
jgi:hypothetical protein